MLRIILGLVGVAVGFVLVWKSEWFYLNFGTIDWAEAKFASFGGSRMMYKMIGLIILFVAFLALTNLHQRFFVSVFGWLFGVKKPEDAEL